jgi:signal transduction histidine kinase
MLSRRNWLVYGALLAIWSALIGWQVVEHLHVRRAARDDLRHTAQNISKTLALVMRQQRFFVRRDRIESALKELVAQGDLLSIVLLNATNEERAVAGAPIDPALKDELIRKKDELGYSEVWNDQAKTVAVMNPAYLGTNIVYSEADRPPQRPGPGPFPPPDENAPPPHPGPGPGAGPFGPDGPTNPPARADGANPPANIEATNSVESNPSPPTNGFGGFRGRRGPPLTPEEREALIRKQGVHGFIMVMSTQSLIAATDRDIITRVFIGVLATLSLAGYWLAWSNLAKTSELQIRLVRASELNSHLKEMNLAAAGLAHETRNPLNIVRGLAQMISRREDAPPEIRARSREIIEETDRITGQLNEFINYSRPREVRRVAVNLNALAAEVVRALNYDLEEKKVQLRVQADPLTIQADEQLLRQALFNLAMNAIQAVPANGEIWIRAGRRNGAEAFVEVADNGPGVAPEHRTELFKPYFTTHAEGTGLGLAVVQQIVLAHGWEIECLPNQPSGAIFRITHIKAAGKA